MKIFIEKAWMRLNLVFGEKNGREGKIYSAVIVDAYIWKINFQFKNLEVEIEVCKCEHFCATEPLVKTNGRGGKLETHLFSHRQHNSF